MDYNLVWKDYGLDKIEEGIAELFPQMSINLPQILDEIMKGNLWGAVVLLWEQFSGGVSAQVIGLKELFIWLLVLGILSSVVSHFVELFDHSHVSDLSFYFMYLLFVSVLMKSFHQILGTAGQTLGQIQLFVKMLAPAYVLALGMCGGTITAAVSYQMMLMVVYAVEYVLAGGILPLITGYCFMSILNGVWMEEKLTMLMDLLRKVIGAVLKVALWVVTGMSVFQSLIAPLLDYAKMTAMHKLVTVIPGIGNAAGGAVELVLGSAVLLRNTVGVVLLLLLLFLCAVPLIKIGLVAGVLKCAAALMGVVTDKRLTGCTDRVGEAGMLLLRTTATAMLLFLIAIAITTALSGRMV